MLVIFSAALLMIVLGTAGVQFFLKLRAIEAAHATESILLSTDRFRPMLRLLSDDDLAIVPAGSKLLKTLRARRRELFREYLHCLTRDYGRLLAGVRLAIVRSGTDRPDLARALAKNRILFAIAICKIEMRLALHVTGIANVEIAGLVDAVEVLRSQVRVLSSVTAAA
jgi:hypothetical protein